MSTPTELRENRAAFIAEILIGLDRARAILDAADARADELAARMDAQLEPEYLLADAWDDRDSPEAANLAVDEPCDRTREGR